MLFQVFVGAGSVWFNGRLFGGGMKAKAVWKYHRYVSQGLFIPSAALIEDEGCPVTSCSFYSS